VKEIRLQPERIPEVELKDHAISPVALKNIQATQA
jgi:hypothetical protein